MDVQYEWDCETVADGDSADYEDGEVLDHSHAATYREAAEFAKTPEAGTRYEIVLVRDDSEGRSWAYMDGGKLPEHFTDASGKVRAKVPQRFRREMAA